MNTFLPSDSVVAFDRLEPMLAFQVAAEVSPMQRHLMLLDALAADHFSAYPVDEFYLSLASKVERNRVVRRYGNPSPRSTYLRFTDAANDNPFDRR